MSVNIPTPEEFENLYNQFFVSSFFDAVINTDEDTSHKTVLSSPNSKLNASEYLLYYVKIPENMVMERMFLLCLVSRIISTYNCKNRQKRGFVANQIFNKMCHMETDAKYAGEKSVERATETAKLAGTYLWRLSQINEDRDVKLITDEWFKKAKEYGLEFDPKGEFLKEAELVRKLGWNYGSDETKNVDMYYVRKSLDSVVSLKELFT